jgi:transposase InsO family protein
LKHRQTSSIAKNNKPSEFIAYGPNQVWTWDISYLPGNIKGIYYYLYMIVDVYSRKIVGFSVHEQELSEHAANLITQACIDEHVLPNQVVLHSDNGGPMKGATMLAKLEELGVIPSFSRPSVSDDNPYSEALFRTVKYHPTFPMLEKFAHIVASRQWSEKFVSWYNNEHLHSALKFVTPHQRHSGADVAIRMNRHAVYTAAKVQHPERWSKATRNWSLPDRVTLNPKKKVNQSDNKSCSQVASNEFDISAATDGGHNKLSG